MFCLKRFIVLVLFCLPCVLFLYIYSRLWEFRTTAFYTSDLYSVDHYVMCWIF